MKHFLLSTALIMGAAGTASAVTLNDVFSSFWVLGDSLSDNGNVFALTGGETPSSPPYFNGRLSNGPVWNEPLLDEFAISGNFAFGGAQAIGGEVPDAATQAGLFSANAAPNAGARPLVSLWFGANDIFNGLIDDPFGTAIASANTVADTARGLAALGVEDFLIVNLPPLGSIPAYNLFAPELIDLTDDLTTTYNLQLAENIAALEAEGLNVVDIDVFGLFEDIAADPGAFGLSDTVLPCLFPSAEAAAAFAQPQVCDPETANDRLFFDAVHPNAIAHAALTDLVRDRLHEEVIAPIPLPAGGVLLIGGLFLLGAARIRAKS